MDWKSHLLFGILLGAAAAYFILNIPLSGLLSFCAISGAAALLPDLDMRKSKASRIIGAAAAVAIAMAAYLLSVGKSLQQFVFYLAVLFLAMFGLDLLFRPKHRGIMHSLIFLAVLAAISFFLFGQFFASAMAVGYFSHLCADACIKAA